LVQSEERKEFVTQRYLHLSPEIRAGVKEMTFAILASPSREARSTSALVIGKIAAIEFPRQMWPTVVELLLERIGSQNQFLRQSSFEALGYVCEECPDKLAEKSIGILNAINHGLRQEEKDDVVKLAAITCLANSLESFSENFANADQRNIIMQMVFTSAATVDVKVRITAYQCLASIGQNYYQYLEQYMAFIFQMTSHAIQQENEEIAKQGVEFWTSICEEEADIKSSGRDQNENRNFTRTALKDIMPLLLVCLTKQSEELDDETWNVAKAAAFCIGMMAETVADFIIPHVLPFVEQNIRHQNWRFKEAATLAFGYILDGPDRKVLGPVVLNAFPVLLQQMSDESDVIKDSTAWAIGRICDLYAAEVINPQTTLPTLIQVFLSGLREAPSIAKNLCWAIHNMAAAVTLSRNAETSMLSQYFQPLVSQLLELTKQVEEPKLVDASFTAINQLIQQSAADCRPMLSQLLVLLLQRLQQTFHIQMQANQPIPEQMQAQGLICGILQPCIRNMGPVLFQPHFRDTMNLLIQVLNCTKSEVVEEAMHAVGVVAETAGPAFGDYLMVFAPILFKGLDSTDTHICSNAVITLQAIATAINHQIFPLGDELMSRLLKNLQNASIDRSVKPIIIDCISDLSLAMGAGIERYLQFVMTMLGDASDTKLDDNDPDNIEWINTLRESILAAYSCILGSLAEASKSGLYVGYLEKILNFLILINGDRNRSDHVLKKALGLITDIALKLLGQQYQRQVLIHATINELYNAGMSSRHEAVRASAQSCFQAVTKALR